MLYFPLQNTLYITWELNESIHNTAIYVNLIILDEINKFINNSIRLFFPDIVTCFAVHNQRFSDPGMYSIGENNAVGKLDKIGAEWEEAAPISVVDNELQ